VRVPLAFDLDLAEPEERRVHESRMPRQRRRMIAVASAEVGARRPKPAADPREAGARRPKLAADPREVGARRPKPAETHPPSQPRSCR
jgi:hypothetical protein